MSLTLKIKESRLSPDGQFFLRAARCQSVENALALRQDEDGYVEVDLGRNGERPAIAIVDGDDVVIPWVIPESCVDAYRADLVGPVKLLNEAGRALRHYPVVGMRWSIPEWIEEYGEKYRVSSHVYVRQMCRGELIGIGGRRKPYQAKLPPPFRGVMDGGRWFITV